MCSSSNKLNDRVRIVTLGCRLNIFESEVIRKLTSNIDEELFIVNTCSVTNAAIRQSHAEVKRIRNKYPNAKIYVTGCSAQLKPELYESLADRVIGNSKKLDAESYSAALAISPIIEDISSAITTSQNILTEFSGRTRAFIEIQNGCNHRCTFCSIPLSRGNSRSTPPDHIIKQISLLVDKGYLDITLTGVDITDYGIDIDTSFSTLVRNILEQVPALPRLRLSSIDVAEVDNELIRLFATHNRLMPHIHLSLQAGNDMILKRMKRRHTRDQVYAFCDVMRAVRPNIMFGTDIITGFPTETDDMFQDGVNMIKDIGFAFLHVFPFSANDNTPAARMPQVHSAVIKERAGILRRLASDNSHKIRKSLIGTTQKVLLETDSSGKTENYIDIRLSESVPRTGQILSVLAEREEDGQLICQLIS